MLNHDNTGQDLNLLGQGSAVYPTSQRFPIGGVLASISGRYLLSPVNDPVSCIEDRLRDA